MEEDLARHLKERLQIPAGADPEFDVRLGNAGPRLDLVLTTDQGVWVIEVKDNTPGPEAVSHLQVLCQKYKSTTSKQSVIGVLVAPVIPQSVREWARALDLQTLEVPRRLVAGAGAKSRVPLTTQKSWQVFSTLLRRPVVGGVRELQEKSGVSLGWVHKVLTELQAQGIVHAERGIIRIVDEEAAFDVVAAERPLRALHKVSMDTGISRWDELVAALERSLHAQDAAGRPIYPLIAAQTAAMAYTNAVVRHDRFQIYAPDPVERYFPDAKGGIPLMIYRPDRAMDAWPETRQIDGGKFHVTNIEQTLLDVLGGGYGQRETAHALLEVMRAG